jgi:hypothetical protein
VIKGVTTNDGGGGSATLANFTALGTAKNRSVQDIGDTTRTNASGNIDSLQATFAEDVANVLELNVTFSDDLGDSFTVDISTFSHTFLATGPFGDQSGDLDNSDDVEYLVIMNVTNAMTPINGSTIDLLGFDVDLSQISGKNSITGLSWLANNLSGTATAGSLGGHLAGGSTGVGGAAPANAGAISATQLRFGGFNGGGGSIKVGETGTVLAGVLTIGAAYTDTSSATTDAFRMTFTSNPEPGTMILGGVGLLIGGAGGYRRRRKAKAKNQEEQAA